MTLPNSRDAQFQLSERKLLLSVGMPIIILNEKLMWESGQKSSLSFVVFKKKRRESDVTRLRRNFHDGFDATDYGTVLSRPRSSDFCNHFAPNQQLRDFDLDVFHSYLLL